MPGLSPRSLVVVLSLTCTLVLAACGDNTSPADAPGGPGADGTGTTTDPNTLPAGGQQLATCVAPVDADFAAFQAKVGGPKSIDACSEQMYAKYGDQGFLAVTQAVIRRALDPNMVAVIGTSFQDKLAGATSDRQAQFASHLKLFLEQVYSGQPLYPSDAPTMVAAHQPLEITFAQYLAFATEVVVPSLREVNVSQSDIDNCFTPPVLADTTVRSMVFCK